MPPSPLKDLKTDPRFFLLISVSNGIPSSRFKSNYASKLSVAAFWTIFLGSCFSLLAFIFGLIPHRITYALATAFTVLAWLGLAIGAAIWTAIYVQYVLSLPSPHSSPDLSYFSLFRMRGLSSVGIDLHFGNGIILTWVSFTLVTLAIVPYMCVVVLRSVLRRMT